MAYVGEIKKRMNVVATMVGKYEYMTYFGYRGQTNFVYRFKDDNGNTLVWKTTNVIGKDEEDEKDRNRNG